VEIDLSQKLHFACTECGRCCQFPAGQTLWLSLEEMIEHAGTFPVMGGFNLPQIYSHAMMDAAARKALGPAATADRLAAEITAQKIAVDAGQVIVQLGIHRVGLAAHVKVVTEVGGACPALSGKLCSIHRHRPLACRIYPVPFFDGPAGTMVDAWSKTAGPGRGTNECDVTTSAPILLELDQAGELIIHDTVINEARKASLDALRQRRDLTLQLLAMEPFAHVDWLAAARAGATPHFGVWPLLLAARRLGLITEAAMWEIAGIQRILLRERIDRAVKQRVSAERERTQMLRQLLAGLEQELQLRPPAAQPGAVG